MAEQEFVLKIDGQYVTLRTEKLNLNCRSYEFRDYFNRPVWVIDEPIANIVITGLSHKDKANV